MKNPAATQHIAGLDHLRALAITLVFLFHYRLFAHPAWIDTLGSFGWTGVDLFFVLSGYLIANQLFGQLKRGDVDLKIFFIKRFFRILPAYWVVLALYFLVPAIREWEHLPPLWKLLTFTQNFNLDLQLQRTFSHAWSLCIEEQFYLLLPFTVLLLRYTGIGKKAIFIVATLFLMGFGIRYWSWVHFIVPVSGTDAFWLSWYKWIYYPTYNRLDGLLAGIAIAGIRNFYPAWNAFFHNNKNIVMLTGILLLGAAWFLCAVPSSFPASILGFPLIAIAYGCMVCSATAPASWLNRIPSALTRGLATLSYSVYLVHKITIHMAQEQCGRWYINEDSNLAFLVSVLFTIAGALLLHWIVERSFLHIKERYLSYLQHGE